ncbi:MAG: RNA polymerase sigma factor RpoE [Legionellales bacterium]|nr:RNA polymerase sigma factor RpoE [Legionellales bacterium]
MPNPKIDERLVKRTLKGDNTAFDVLILKYQHKVAKLISRYIHDTHEIKDVTQEVFIKAYRALHQFRGDSAFYTWLYRIAVNTAKNYHIEHTRHLPESGIDILDEHGNPPSSKLQEIASPEHELLTEEIQRTVINTVDQLPEELRMTILLREIEGLSYEEIASVMQCPVGTVRSRLFRAREAVDERLKPLLKDK